MSNLKTNDPLSLTVTWLLKKEHRYPKKVHSYSLSVALQTKRLERLTV